MVTDIQTAMVLAPCDPPPFTLVNPAGGCPLVLVCDHASNRIPEKLANLGLGTAELATHIAWDPGAALVAEALSKRLDAALVLSGYSRLVIDCNRPLASPQLMTDKVAGVPIPGNSGLSAAEREARIREVFQPYHDTISDLLRRRAKPSALLSIHSFTPLLDNEHRPWHIGISCYRNDQLARALFTALLANQDVMVGYNLPYAVEKEFDYTIPEHAERQGIPSAMVEIRQDGIADTAEADRWAQRLAQAWGEVETSLEY